MTELEAIREGWDRAAREDAMFNIITDPSKINGGWTPDDFFAHGRLEVDAAIERLGSTVVKGRALDFGCGVGRLTQALAHHFKRVSGADVSPEMVEQARSLNRCGKRVEYRVNTERLPFRTNAFDFVYSVIVLQHMEPDLQEVYVREFVRVLKPGGLAVFQLPEGTDMLHWNRWLSVWCSDRGTVERWLADAGAEVVSADKTCALGRGPEGWEYTVKKQGGEPKPSPATALPLQSQTRPSVLRRDGTPQDSESRGTK